MINCFRCGRCCKGFIAIVPKKDDSDLSPDFLESMDFDEKERYVEENHEFQGEKCKWLDDTDIQCTCKAYDRRSSDCRNHCADHVCKIGMIYFWKLLDDGVKLPKTLVDELKEYRYWRHVQKSAQQANAMLKELNSVKISLD